MTKIFRTAIVAAMLASTGAAATVATPAAAQIAGFATSNPELVLLRANARTAAYQQIGQQYAAQIEQINQLTAQLSPLEQQIDTNGDGQVTQAEATANAAALQQAQSLGQQIDALSRPIQLAQMYALEQLIVDYGNSRDTAMQAKGVQVLLDPQSVQMSPQTFDITPDILATLNQRVPTVQITPPAGWQPNQTVLQTHQAISQLIGFAIRRAQFDAAQQQQAGQPATQPVAPAPQGR